jgi:hypothetical protein
MDITNIISGLIGSAIGVVSAFLIAIYQSRCAAKENEKQRAHDFRLNAAKEKHDKDMQRREQNIKNTGIASMREIGGG